MLQDFSIKFVTFAIDFIPFAIEFAFAIEFVTLAIEFGMFTIELGVSELQFIMFAGNFITTLSQLIVYLIGKDRSKFVQKVIASIHPCLYEVLLNRG